MCQVASVCRGSAWNENLESLLVDWKLETISHYNSIPHLEILQNHSKNSSDLAFPATEKWAAEWSRDFLLSFALRLHPFVVLKLSSFLPFRAHFGFEYFGELFLSPTILLVDELVLVETQYIRVERPVSPIFEHKFAAEIHSCKC